MRLAKPIIAIALLLVPAAMAYAADLAMNDAPYSPIVARNIFGLLPIPTNPVEANTQPTTPPPKIVPNGLMNLFNVPQALFKVSYPPAAGQPAHEQSYMLAQGESQDNIEVVKIDMAAAIVTFNNNGTMQELPLAAAPKITSPAAPVGNPGGGIGGGPSGVPGGGNSGGIPRPIFGGGSRSRLPVNNSGAGTANPDGASMPSFGGGVPTSAQGKAANADQLDGLSPETQVLLMEKQRLDWQEQGKSALANMLPPTPITPHEENGNQ